MAGPVAERSGRAVAEYCRLINFTPKRIVTAGVGIRYPELDALRREFPQMGVVGFEPNHETYEAVRLSFPGILFNVALADIKDNHYEILWYGGRHRNGGSLIEPKSPDDYQKVNVKCETLDSYGYLYRTARGNEVHARPDLFWLDCEGSELRALKGAAQYLDSRVGIVNVELTSQPRTSGWCQPYEVDRFLRSHGFFHVMNHTLRTCICQVDAVYVHESMFNGDYCMIPSSIELWDRKQRADEEDCEELCL